MPYKKYLSFAVPYGVAVSLLYLFGYWGYFDLNVLEFIGFAEIAKLALYPLLGSLVLLLIAFVFSEMVSVKLPPGGTITRTRQFGRKHWRGFIAIHLLLIVLSVIFLPAKGKWFVVALLVALSSTPMTHIDYFNVLLPNPKVRHTVLFLFLYTAAMAFAFGNLDAQLKKDG